MNDLNQLESHLDQMFTSKKVKKARTFVAKYKGQTIVTNSGKSSWKAVNHAKAALLLHFSKQEDMYAYDWDGITWRYGNNVNYSIVEERRQQFREKLWQLISIEELR
jgi:hypothetical protein